MDYKMLLQKYMDHVMDSEGISFIGDNYYDKNIFSKEELEYLQKLDNTISSQ